MWRVVSMEDVIMKYENLRARKRQDDQPASHKTILESTPNKTTQYDQQRRSVNTDMHCITRSTCSAATVSKETDTLGLSH